jgi:hypothetical protein
LAWPSSVTGRLSHSATYLLPLPPSLPRSTRACPLARRCPPLTPIYITGRLLPYRPPIHVNLDDLRQPGRLTSTMYSLLLFLIGEVAESVSARAPTVASRRSRSEAAPFQSAVTPTSSSRVNSMIRGLAVSSRYFQARAVEQGRDSLSPHQPPSALYQDIQECVHRLHHSVSPCGEWHSCATGGRWGRHSHIYQ